MSELNFNAVLAINVSDLRFVAWDTETTGIDFETDHIVEIAAVAFDEEFEHRRFQTLVKPPMKMPAFVEKIHGISDAMLVDAPDARQALVLFENFLASAGRPRVLVAHNAAFDLGMVGREMKILSTGVTVDGAELVLDSCMLAKSLLPDLKTHKLSALADFFKIETGTLHRAEADVAALKEVFLKLLGLAADQISGGKGLLLSDLVEFSGGYFVYAPWDSAVRKHPFRLTPKIEKLEEICGMNVKVGISYGDDEDYRYITPIRVKHKGMRVFIEAHCHRDDIVKTFRVDKIKSVKVSE